MNKIILIGFMSTGKTSVARALSIKKNIIHIDTDLVIEKKFNLKIDEIFYKYGEPFFREQESLVFKKYSEFKFKHDYINRWRYSNTLI